MTLTNLTTCLLFVGMLVIGSSTQAADILIVIDLTSDAEFSFYYKVKMLGHNPALFAKALKLADISQPLYMAFSRQTSTELVDAFRRALETVKRKGIYDTIHRKYLR